MEGTVNRPEYIVDDTLELAESKPLSEGGYAEVYRVKDLNHGDSLAFKVPLETTDPEVTKLILLEGKRQQFMRHPNVLPAEVKTIKIGEHARTGILMPEIPRKNFMDEVLQNEESFSVREIKEAASGLASALDEHASRGFAGFNDLKPENVAFSPDDGRVLLCDFGISGRLYDRTANMATKPGQRQALVGSPESVAPERIMRKGGPSTESDQYALAYIVYALATGEKVFDTTNYTKNGASQQEAQQAMLFDRVHMDGFGVNQKLAAKLPEEQRIRLEIIAAEKKSKLINSLSKKGMSKEETETFVDAMDKALKYNPEQRFHSSLEKTRESKRSNANEKFVKALFGQE